MKNKLTKIKGIGKTFEKDFARIKMISIEDFKDKVPEMIFAKLEKENSKENHKTSKNYLYVIRMICYVADGGTDQSKLKWSYWKDK
jgi:hypothetical protein